MRYRQTLGGILTNEHAHQVPQDGIIKSASCCHGGGLQPGDPQHWHCTGEEGVWRIIFNFNNRLSLTACLSPSLQVVVGVLGFFISFAWVDAILGIALGATVISAYNSTTDPVNRAAAISRSCVTGLAIAEFVIGSISILVFIIVTATVGVLLYVPLL